MKLLDGAIEATHLIEPMRIEGSVAALRGLTLLVRDLPVVVGSVVHVLSAGGERPAEVVGFDGRQAIVMMLGQTTGVRVGDRVVAQQASPTLGVGPGMLGRVIDGLGRPIDSPRRWKRTASQPINPVPIGALRRRRISEALGTGVRAIDGFVTLGRGQRVGIFAGPGVGKSTLLAMIARRATSDVNVIALIGERGREVREFIEDTLGPEGLARSVVVVATSDESPLMRVRAALVASSVAEFFRDQGNDVLFVLDSITRFAHAQRQIGLAVGEPPATKGYTPSVFAKLPELLERAGAVEGDDTRQGGSVTGLYTILVEGDDMTEPISDAVRGILDGHVMLSRRLAQRAHFPAIDVLDSVSRVASSICSESHSRSGGTIRRLLASHAKNEDLIQIGAYASGADPDTDVAIAMRDEIDGFLCQRVDEAAPFGETVAALESLAAKADAMRQSGGRGSAQRPPQRGPSR